ncbi:hypothetical protein BO70DRAFT_351844 [Aspergillus heteromorphus CBS 117.55]|uniref:Uncharacterized protein n=1 Tax=Aspergillus heteromorphus CBS 117.55 TaxID=1448321 RepID=A0A317WJM0_9EURO|nr:uncharacterized protein BO70DRAFT_351844 [Aspergillus heteromorphus CBS 117.55]PWY86255.1 hypothetical protein BO70DRAFT_351844 [Aspergillus heteromorphus CBS 117.55]
MLIGGSTDADNRIGGRVGGSDEEYFLWSRPTHLQSGYGNMKIQLERGCTDTYRISLEYGGSDLIYLRYNTNTRNTTLPYHVTIPYYIYDLYSLYSNPNAHTARFCMVTHLSASQPKVPPNMVSLGVTSPYGLLSTNLKIPSTQINNHTTPSLQ